MKNLSGGETLTVSEFAKLMGVKYQTVVWWLQKGQVPGAYQQGDGEITIKRWRIPRQALEMQRPKRGPGGPRKNKIKPDGSKDQQIKDLRGELADLNKRHNDHMLEYAGLLGRYELAQAELRTVKGSLEAELVNVEMMTRQRDDFRRLYEEVLAQRDQQSKELTALVEEVRSLKEELSLWHEKKMKSLSTPSTD